MISSVAAQWSTDKALTIARSRSMAVLIASLFALTAGLADPAFAVDGDFDTSFGPGGTVAIPFNFGGSLYDFGEDVAVQDDGMIVVIGTVTSSAGDFDFGIARIDSYGALDAGFGSLGKRSVYFDLGGNNRDEAYALAIQADGKIVVVGTVERVTGTDIGVVRLKPDGDLDPTFGSGGTTTIAYDPTANRFDSGIDVLIQADGKIVVAGSVETGASNGDYDFAAFRLTTTGTLDTTFSNDGKILVAFDLGWNKADFCNAIAMQSDDKIVLAGSAELAASSYDMAIARLSTDGELDLGFNGDGKATVAFDLTGSNWDSAYAVAIQEDGKILVAGSTLASDPIDFDFAVARLTSTGVLDPTFSFDGKATIAFDMGDSNWDEAHGMAVEAGGTIVLVGRVRVGTHENFGVARLRNDGAIDSSFGFGGKTVFGFSSATRNEGEGVTLQADGKIVVVGNGIGPFGDVDYVLARRSPMRYSGTALTPATSRGGRPARESFPDRRLRRPQTPRM